MIEWDTFQLFNWLLNNFKALVTTARRTPSPNSEDTLEVKVAIVGFYQFSSPDEWRYGHWRIINNRLLGELSSDSLSPDYGDCVANFTLFACLALGAMLGKSVAGEIDDAGFMLGDVHLPGFMSLKLEQICSTQLN